MGINFTEVALIAKEHSASRNIKPGLCLAKFERYFCPGRIRSCSVNGSTVVEALLELGHQSGAQSATASLDHADGKVSLIRISPG